jgi:UDP-glucose 4-epimerase
MDILITGGTGFIGSHTCVKLLLDNYKVIIIDNLINSSEIVIKNIKKIVGEKKKNLIFYKIDLNNNIDFIFKKHNIEYVIHFAGLKSVFESVENPLLYYTQNISMTLNLLNIMEKNGCNKLIFSSSATVYGECKSPVSENHPIGQNISNPYGNTKYIIEKILMDVCVKEKNTFISLRYFNPIGAHPSGLIGENPNNKPNNLMPTLLKIAYKNNIKDIEGAKHLIGTKGSLAKLPKGFEESLGFTESLEYYDTLNIFGVNYNTPDKTAIRDYIHVEDLAMAHLQAIKNIEKLKGYNVFNVGTGTGTSVKEIVEIFKKINNVKIPINIADRREGDIEEIYCDNFKINKVLGFKPKYDLNDMCSHAWNYQKKFYFFNNTSSL